MNGFRARLYRFMEGRYGLRGARDMLQFVLYGVYLVLVIINIFARSRIVYGMEWLIIFYSLFRILSKNIPARENESRVVSLWVYKIRDAFRFQKAKAEERKHKRAVQKERRQDKEHIYRECPECGATLRLPRKKGKHSVLCPRCGSKFNVKC